MVAYQSDHDLEKLKQGLDHWRPWALSRHSKNIYYSELVLRSLLEQSAGLKQKRDSGTVFASGKNTQDKNKLSPASG